MDIPINLDSNAESFWIHIELFFPRVSMLWSSLSLHCSFCCTGTFPLQKMLSSSICSVFVFGFVELFSGIRQSVRYRSAVDDDVRGTHLGEGEDVSDGHLTSFSGADAVLRSDADI